MLPLQTRGLRHAEPGGARRDQRRHRERRQIHQHDIVGAAARHAETPVRRERERAGLVDAGRSRQHHAREAPDPAAQHVLEHAIRSAIRDQHLRRRPEQEALRHREPRADHRRGGAAGDRKTHDAVAVGVAGEHLGAAQRDTEELRIGERADHGQGAARQGQLLDRIGRLGEGTQRIGEVERVARRIEGEAGGTVEPRLQRRRDQRTGGGRVAPDLAGSLARDVEHAGRRAQRDAARVLEALRDGLREDAREGAARRVIFEHGRGILRSHVESAATRGASGEQEQRREQQRGGALHSGGLRWRSILHAWGGPCASAARGSASKSSTPSGYDKRAAAGRGMAAHPSVPECEAC